MGGRFYTLNALLLVYHLNPHPNKIHSRYVAFVCAGLYSKWLIEIKGGIKNKVF